MFGFMPFLRAANFVNRAYEHYFYKGGTYCHKLVCKLRVEIH